MKKICFVTTTGITIRSFLADFAAYLNESGDYDVTFICADDERVAALQNEHIHFIAVHMSRGMDVGAMKAVSKLKKIFKEQKFDIVQYSTPNAAFYASIAANQSKVPVRLYCQWGIRYMGLEGWKRSLFKALERITCKNSTFVEAESFGIQEYAKSEQLYGEVPNCVIGKGSACGVDLKKFDYRKKNEWRQEIREKYHFSEDDVVFSFAARLTADKGINELMASYCRLSEKNKNCKLLIMGGADKLGSLDQMLYTKFKSSPNVVFTGHVPDIEKYYAAADIFVAPSYREGFGLVVVEAEAMGLPAIVTDVPGQRDAVIPNQTGLLCELKNVESLCQRMEELLVDADKRKKMAEAAHILVEKDYEQTILFEQLMKHRDFLIEESVKCPR